MGSFVPSKPCFPLEIGPKVCSRQPRFLSKELSYICLGDLNELGPIYRGDLNELGSYVSLRNFGFVEEKGLLVNPFPT